MATKINPRKLELATKDKSDSEAREAHTWGTAAGVLYDMAFLDSSMRTSVRLLVEKMTDIRSPKYIGDCMRLIASVALDEARAFDAMRDEMMAEE